MEIKEDYCNFETAKLLKEKGFDIETNTYYYATSEYMKSEMYKSPNNTNWNNNEYYYSAPTHQMAMKWLREKHYIYAEPIKQGNYNDCSEYYTWIVSRTGIIHRNSTVVDKLSYEKAVEAALKFSLENLI